MPVYDYKCQQCGKITEFRLTGFSDSKKPLCQSCGSPEMERLISAPSLVKSAASSGTTCCGRAERCEKPPCSSGGKCHRG